MGTYWGETMVCGLHFMLLQIKVGKQIIRVMITRCGFSRHPPFLKLSELSSSFLNVFLKTLYVRVNVFEHCMCVFVCVCVTACVCVCVFVCVSLRVYMYVCVRVYF